jgi:hypothetical protein
MSTAQENGALILPTKRGLPCNNMLEACRIVSTFFVIWCQRTQPALTVTPAVWPQ